MRLSYDPKYNIGYLRFHEKSGPVTTLKISEDMNIDIAPRRYRLWHRDPQCQ